MQNHSFIYFYDLDFKSYNTSERGIPNDAISFCEFAKLLEKAFVDQPELDHPVKEGDRPRGGVFEGVFNFTKFDRFYQIRDLNINESDDEFNLTLLVSCADKVLPDVTYTDFENSLDETFPKGDNRGVAYSSHILFRYIKSTSRTLVLYEANSNMSHNSFSEYFRGVISNIRKLYPDNFKVDHPRGESDKKGVVKKLSCQISFWMKGHPSAELEKELTEGV